MAPCFVPSTPLSAPRSSFAPSLTCRLPVQSTNTSTAQGRRAVTMSDSKKNQSLGDWLYSKIMHNALWEGDQEVGYEPFFVEAMSAREEKQKEAYKEIDDKKRGL